LTVISPLYVSAGGKCVKTDVPSMPTHSRVWCGKRLTRFQEIFWVRKNSMPASRTICGSAPEYPNESGSHATRDVTPKCSRK
jgi:hypothetical protein